MSAPVARNGAIRSTPQPTVSPRRMSSSTLRGPNRWACSITSAAVGPSVVSTIQPRADNASCRLRANRAWSSTMSTRLGMTSGPPELEHELGARAGTGANVDRAVLFFHEATGDVEAEPAAGAVAASNAALEDVLD